jgi:predicted flap endonuclease-1-like 5' DNA nuclease
MIHYLIELALWMLLAYFIGCLLGWALRYLFGKPAAVETVAPVYKAPTPAYVLPVVAAPVVSAPVVAAAVAAPVIAAAIARPTPPAARPTPEPVRPTPARVVAAPAPVAARVVAAPAPVAAKVAAAPSGRMERPKGLSKARGGKADNLQRISGIGPKNESILHTLGFFHFDQIAEWTASQVSWVDDHLRFNGRIGREEWIKQAKLLATGKEAEFAKQYGTGGLRNAKGETLSGARTRK